MRERELRRSTRSFHSNEELRDCNGEVDTYGNGNEFYPSGGDKGAREDDFFERIATSKPLNDGFERPDDRLPKQHLLVVANRLPVSAVRKGEDSWSLEISIGGLVSALLGKYLVLMLCIW